MCPFLCNNLIPTVRVYLFLQRSLYFHVLFVCSSIFEADEVTTNVASLSKTYDLSTHGISEIKAIFIYQYFQAYNGAIARFDLSDGNGGYTSRVVRYGTAAQYNGYANWSLNGTNLTVSTGGYGSPATGTYEQYTCVFG